MIQATSRKQEKRISSDSWRFQILFSAHLRSSDL
jgi:hypothetical protein